MAASLAPALYSIPAGHAFLSCLVTAIMRGEIPPEVGRPERADFGDYTILVPTRRAARALRDVFWQESECDAILLPKIRPLGDVDEDDAILMSPELDWGASGFDVPPAIATLDRQLLLARFIVEWAESRRAGGLAGEDSLSRLIANPAQAVSLAAELGGLIDHADTEQVDLSALTGLVADQFAENWQLTLDFLNLLFQVLPAYLQNRGLINPMARRNLLLKAEADRIKASPPSGPIIAAGSTGSIPATAELLKTIAELPLGAVVLPGLDEYLDGAAWDEINEAHPQYGLKQLLEKIGARRSDVTRLPFGAPDANLAARNQLFSEVMRPAATSDEWAHTIPAMGSKSLEAARNNITLIEAASEREEAQAISLILRSVADNPGQTAALITPDRLLARRVAVELRRWRIDIDDSAGTPLDKSPPGVLLLLLIDAVHKQFAPVELAALLKHPLVTLGLSRGELLKATRLMELAALRGPRPAPGFAGIKKILSTYLTEAGGGEFRHRSRVPLEEEEVGVAIELVGQLQAATAPLAALFDTQSPLSLAHILRVHIEVAERLTQASPDAGEQEIATLWLGEAGETLGELCTSLNDAAANFGPLAASDYPALLEAVLRRGVTRPMAAKHPRLHIWGLLEARLQPADIVILGGLNETVWPGAAIIDPWVNRPMRAEIGLQPPERRIGLSAHDFIQAACSPTVYLTRSRKIGAAPAIASRWLLRLTALLADPSRTSLAAAGEVWLERARGLDATEKAEPIAPPAPRPPVAARPRRLSVTDIENWVRDPYAIYARRILGLTPLEPMDSDPNAAERGALLHSIFQRFTEDGIDPAGDDAYARLREIGKDVFAAQFDRPGVAAFWWPRFERMAKWFIAQEPGLQKSVTSQFSEMSGMLSLAAPAGPFELVGRADRIDRLESGALRIYDYKTGQIPSIAQIVAGFNSQLPLEAAIAVQGGYKGLDAAPVEQLGYIRLTGAVPAGQIVIVTNSQSTPEDLAGKAWQGVAKRVALFDDAQTPYLPSAARDFEQMPRDYDHLARYREWALNLSSDRTAQSP